jgi:pimeloyl-ACP methyl ester carboxylesterase
LAHVVAERLRPARLERAGRAAAADERSTDHGLFSEVTAAGEVTTLSDPRFAAANVKAGMKAPYDFILNVGPGFISGEVRSIAHPVLFVHGIDGFARQLQIPDRASGPTTFPGVGLLLSSRRRLGLIADHMAQAVSQVERQYRVPTLIVVAHSMGWPRSAVLLLTAPIGRLHIPLFISLSTPWSGQQRCADRARPFADGGAVLART